MPTLLNCVLIWEGEGESLNATNSVFSHCIPNTQLPIVSFTCLHIAFMKRQACLHAHTRKHTHCTDIILLLNFGGEKPPSGELIRNTHISGHSGHPNSVHGSVARLELTSHALGLPGSLLQNISIPSKTWHYDVAKKSSHYFLNFPLSW